MPQEEALNSINRIDTDGDQPRHLTLRPFPAGHANRSTETVYVVHTGIRGISCAY